MPKCLVTQRLDFLEAVKSKEKDSLLESPEGTQPCQHIDFIPVGPMSDFRSPER